MSDNEDNAPERIWINPSGSISDLYYYSDMERYYSQNPNECAEYILKSIVDNGIQIYEIALSNKKKKVEEILNPIREMFEDYLVNGEGHVPLDMFIAAIRKIFEIADKENK